MGLPQMAVLMLHSDMFFHPLLHTELYQEVPPKPNLLLGLNLQDSDHLETFSNILDLCVIEQPTQVPLIISLLRLQFFQLLELFTQSIIQLKLCQQFQESMPLHCQNFADLYFTKLDLQTKAPGPNGLQDVNNLLCQMPLGWLLPAHRGCLLLISQELVQLKFSVLLKQKYYSSEEMFYPATPQKSGYPDSHLGQKTSKKRRRHQQMVWTTIYRVKRVYAESPTVMASDDRGSEKCDEFR